MYVKILIMARTGMREGEMLALQVEDLDFDKNQIWVRRTWGSRNARKNLTCINLPKNGKIRLVDMFPQLKAILQDYLSSTHLKGPWLFPGASTDRLPMTPNGFAWHWRRLLKNAGLPHRGPHALRHTYASLLIAQGENILFIKEQLGHASVKITLDNYGHMLPRSGVSGSSRLDDDDWQSLPPNASLNRNLGATRALRLVKKSIKPIL